MYIFQIYFRGSVYIVNNLNKKQSEPLLLNKNQFCLNQIILYLKSKFFTDIAIIPDIKFYAKTVCRFSQISKKVSLNLF
jgi:hypothetical protein